MRYCSEVGRPSRQKTPSSTSVVTRLHEDELQQLAELTSFWGTGSRSETVRRALREATARTRGLLAELLLRVTQGTADVRAGRFRLGSDDQALIRAAELDLLFLAKSPEERVRIETELLPAVLAFFLAHRERWGWFYPDETETLTEALTGLRRRKVRAGRAFLKGMFRSFWDTLDGPAQASLSEVSMRSVVRHRMGLNKNRVTHDLSPRQIRQGFAVQKLGVSFFDPAWAFGLVERWCPSGAVTLWDPCGGFGARMLGFAAARPGGTYVCCEPAEATSRDLKILGGLLASEIEVQVHQGGSEFFSLPPNSVDLVLTSPPYFNKERYFDEPSQSWRLYPTEVEWVEGFLRPTLLEAAHALRPGCHAVFNVDEERKEATVEAAHEAGLTLVDQEELVLPRGPMRRAPGAGDRIEPVLIFWKGEG